MPHVLPPYRADVVGSFLRPAAVAQARAAFARGELSREALTAVEDEEIAALVKKELDNGLTAVTDGEFRRAFWHLDFLAGLKGIRHVKADGPFTSKVVSPRPRRSSSRTASPSPPTIRSSRPSTA